MALRSLAEALPSTPVSVVNTHPPVFPRTVLTPLPTSSWVSLVDRVFTVPTRVDPQVMLLLGRVSHLIQTEGSTDVQATLRLLDLVTHPV